MNRSRVKLAIRYGSERLKLVTDQSVNLSIGGVYVETHEVFPAGTPLFVEFTLPGMNSPVTCKGKVAWVNDPDRLSSVRLPPGMGLQFFSLSLDHMNALRRFLGVGNFPTE
jgi:uncharacterized protein (TIGR02266 family)